METPTEKGGKMPEKSVVLSPTGDRVEVLFNTLDLNAQNPTSPEILLTVEKLPIQLVEGKSYLNNSIFIDRETPAMRDFANQAEALRNIPEQARPRAVMDLFRSQVHYAYNDVVEKLAETNPNLAEWVAKNTGFNSSGSSNIPLSELVEKKYGICKHLAVGYLWLAQKAGLQGAIMTSDHGVLKNITRADNGEKLFKSVDVGQSASAHAWVEIKLSDGRWIPVDPTVRLVGDTKEGLNMFREANYYGYIADALDLATGQKELSPRGSGLGFNPGQKTTQVRFCLELNSTKPILVVGGQNKPPTNKPYHGDGRLLINTTESAGKLRLKIINVK